MVAKKLKILINPAALMFSDETGQGEGITAYEILSKLVQRGYDITIMAPESKITRDKEIKRRTLDSKVRIFPMIDSLREEINWFYYTYNSFTETKRLLKTMDFDIIHHFLPSYSGRFSFLWELNKPFVYGPVSLEPKTEIDFSNEFVRTYEKNSNFENKMVNSLSKLSMKYYLKTLNKADKIIVTLDKVKSRLPKNLTSKIVTIPFGVDTKVYRPNKNKTDKNFILSIANLTAIKGIEYLLKAMKIVLKRLPDVKLYIAGDGPDKNYLKVLASKLGISGNVIFLGYVDNSKIPDLINRSSLYIQPSLFEAFGVARLKAMACAKPVIYTYPGASSGGFNTYRNIGLIKPRDPKIIANYIFKFLMDEEFSEFVGNKNREIAVKFYDIENIIDKYEKLYYSLVD